jgi:hypothetical protein
MQSGCVKNNKLFLLATFNNLLVGKNTRRRESSLPEFHQHGGKLGVTQTFPKTISSNPLAALISDIILYRLTPDI